MISLKGLIEAIFLFEGAKRRVFGLWLLIIRFFKEKYLKPHFGNISWEGEF